MPASVLVVAPAWLRAQLFDGESESALSAAAADAGGALAVVDDLEAAEGTEGVRALVTSWGLPRLDRALLERFPRLGLVAHTGASVKFLVSDELFARGIRVTQAGAAMARPVAEVSLAFTLALLHRVPRFDHALHAGEAWERAEGQPPQHELLDAPIGVVGASRTGRAFIGLLRAIGARVLLADPTLDPADADALGARLVPLDELLALSRVTALHAPSLPATERLIGARELALMPDGAGLVNTARSWLVDEEALLRELATGRIDAALDVFDDEPLPSDSPFRGLANVLLVPHKAAGTVEGRRRQGRLVAEEVRRFAAGAPLEHAILPRDLEDMA